MRALSRENDESPITLDQSKGWVWKNTVTASVFTVWFGLTVGSTTPWLWLMSIDVHWYSTMYSWYTFASSFVSGIALITLFVIYLKNRGYLEYTSDEHLHDLGKFMFAFSIFWTYLWFSQYMLIWYSNQPEETAYFQPRTSNGAWKGLFYLDLVINFVCPLLILMTRNSKRNYTIMTFMAILILFGHWLDFNQMVMASISRDHVTLSLLDFGIMALFVGMIIFFVGRALAKVPLIAKNNPFLKESIIHHT
jgi:Ni/Fe-hydrogenase subunit HybB-like protein